MASRFSVGQGLVGVSQLWVDLKSEWKLSRLSSPPLTGHGHQHNNQGGSRGVSGLLLYLFSLLPRSACLSNHFPKPSLQAGLSAGCI